MSQENKAYSIKDDEIIIHRELTELDLFVKDFLNILKNHTSYMIVSGFVTICAGRTRATEDVDVLVPIMEKDNFKQLFSELNNDFWCYQGDNPDELYEYIKEMQNIRFARKDEMFPNMEMIPINETRKLKFYEFMHSQKVRIKDFEFLIPPIEFEIMYKEIILGSDKDIADAQYLRQFFAEIIEKTKLQEYEKMMRDYNG